MSNSVDGGIESPLKNEPTAATGSSVYDETLICDDEDDMVQAVIEILFGCDW